MSAIAVHSEIATHYTDAGFMAFDHVPDGTFAPGDGVLVVIPSDNWITRDDEDISFNLDEVLVNIEILILVEYRENNEEVTELLAAVLGSFLTNRPPWLTVGHVSAPDLHTNGEWHHFGVRIAAKTISTL